MAKVWEGVQFESYSLRQKPRFFGAFFDKNNSGEYKGGCGIMLSKPDAGWTDFKIKEKTYSLSYLTAVPFDWLTQAIHGLETMLPFTVHGFCEPGRVLCTISYWNCYIVHCIDEDYEEDTEEIQTEYIHKNMMEFCEDLHRDIKENIDDWCKWFRDYEAETEEEENAFNAKIKMQLEELLTKLEALIIEKKHMFRGGYAFL